jgi:glycerol-3-phosphate acyltransferase PlsY
MELWFILLTRKSRYRRYVVGDIGVMEVVYSALLVVSAFWLGACPFSVWIGRWLLGKDIRDYGDGNPGAANVFRAGGRKSGSLALILDVAKGVPFVVLAHLLFGFPDLTVMAIGLSAILGHAFSPLLRLRGGKSIAVTFGVLIALPQSYILITFVVLMLLGFLFIENDAWIVMFGATGTSAYLAIIRGGSWELLFMLGVLAILAVKHFDDLRTMPRVGGRLINWLQSRRRET